MHLTASEKMPLQLPLNKKPPRPETRNTRKLYDWVALNEKYGGNTVAYIHEQTGIAKTTLYKAAKRGDIKVKMSIWLHDWEAINILAKERTIKQLAYVTGLSEEHLRSGVKRGKITDYIRINSKPHVICEV